MATSRHRGTGRIIARPRKDGTTAYLVRVYLGTRPDGSRIDRNETVIGTRKDAERRVRELLGRKDERKLIQQSRQTVAAFLLEWIDDWHDGISDRTRASYRYLIEKYIIPEIGHHRLSALTDTDVKRLYDGLRESGKSARTIRYTAGVLKAALAHGVARGLVPSNAAALVKTPKLARRDMQVLTPEQARAFLAAAREDRWFALWHLLMSCGLRPGEALALRWTDLEGDLLRVQRARVYVAGKGWSDCEPKTSRSRRSISLPGGTVRALKEHKKRQAEERLRAGDAYDNQGFMFAGPLGQPIGLKALTDAHFKPLLRGADLPPIRLYDLRHTAATLMLSNNEHPKVVAERLGHSTVTLTLDTYSHVLPDMQRAAASRMDALLSETA